VIADLRQGTVPPAGLSEREQSAYQFALRLTRDRRVDEALFLTAERALGTGALTDIVLLAGRYHVTWAVLNAFEIPAPRG
jgi:hypothetical protein